MVLKALKSKAYIERVKSLHFSTIKEMIIFFSRKINDRSLEAQISYCMIWIHSHIISEQYVLEFPIQIESPKIQSCNSDHKILQMCSFKKTQIRGIKRLLVVFCLFDIFREHSSCNCHAHELLEPQLTCVWNMHMHINSC
jgi:hypothetical protein